MYLKQVGKCSICNGVVGYPEVWHGVQLPPLMCQSCGAISKNTQFPTIQMEKPVTFNKQYLFNFDSN